MDMEKEFYAAKTKYYNKQEMCVDLEIQKRQMENEKMRIELELLRRETG